MVAPRLSGLLAGALLALVGASANAPRDREQELRAALARLEAPEAAERLAAERWLAAHLEPRDLPALVERSASAPAETLRRLERALGTDDRHLELVGLLLADPADPARVLGRAVLERMMASWLGEHGLEPLPPLRVLGALAQRGASEYRLHLTAGPLGPTLEQVVRLAGGGVGRRAPGERMDVALDPALVDVSLPSGPAVPESVDGEFLTLLFTLAGIQTLEVEGFGLDRLEGRNAWLHVTTRERAGSRSADELVAGWLREVIEGSEPARRRAAACALAGSGWSAATAWLERRWIERGDGAALEGLALAASRGRVAPSLATHETVRRLLQEVDTALATRTPAGDQRADRARFALAALPPLGSDGSDLAALAAEGLERAAPREAFVRLAVLAGMGAVPGPTRAWLRARLADADPRFPPFLRLEALRALAASRPVGEEPWGRLEGATALLELAAARDGAGAIGTWMRSARLAPPEAWRDPRALPAGWGGWLRLIVAEAWLACPDGAPVAAEHLLRVEENGASDPRVEQRLRRLAAGPLGPRLASLLDEPEAETLGPRGRLALLAGLLPERRHPGALASLTSSRADADPGDLLLLGALAAGPVRDGATKALLGRVREALAAKPSEDPAAEPWARACERAWCERLAAGLDEEATELRADIGRILREARYPAEGPGLRLGADRSHPLASELTYGRWPRLTGSEATALTELESPLPAP